MKQGSFKAVCLILLAFTVVFSAFGDDRTVNSETVIIERFDGSTDHVWERDGRTRTEQFEWRLDASKFATRNGDDVYPKLSIIPSFPQALFGRNPPEDNKQSLGIWGRFDRRGYNWIDIYPVAAGTEDAYEIAFPGRVQVLDLWVWGSNMNMTLEAYVRDYQGIVHVLNLGSINHTGWKNLRVNVPTSVPQSKRVLPSHGDLTFVKFRINTMPTERVDNFYVYFDHFKIQTDLFETLYDGNELDDPETVQEFWSASSNN
ncbi:membrane protein [Spirochaetia bacterium]|nr:membrane protein [Spirochaetia bacterium]